MAKTTLALVSLTRAKPYLGYIAGSAGSVLAKRLTEDHETSILLLEAGGDVDSQGTHNSGTALELLHSAVDWD